MQELKKSCLDFFIFLSRWLPAEWSELCAMQMIKLHTFDKKLLGLFNMLLTLMVGVSGF